MPDAIILILAAGIAVVGGFAVTIYARHIKQLPQVTHLFLPSLPLPKKTDRILVVVPHQDDETIGVGAYLHRAVKAGSAIKIIYATDGNKRGLKAVRNDEVNDVLLKLGLSSGTVSFYDYPDGQLASQADFSGRLEKDVRDFAPTKIFTTIAEDLHPDHSCCGRVVSEISENTDQDYSLYFFLIHFRRYSRPIGDNTVGKYLLPPPQLINNQYRWISFPLNESDRQIKRELLNCYKSQLKQTNPILRQIILSFDRKNELFAEIV